jgi:ribose transport system substrate-binding protein
MSLSRVVYWSACVLVLAALPGCGSDKPQSHEKYGKFTLYGIKYDNVDQGRAKDNAADMLTQMGGEKNVVMVGLWAYNPPAILEAVKAAKKEGEVKIVGFDEDDNTLRGVAEGNIYATVVQQPFEFGYQSVKLMAELARDPKAPLPKDAVDGVLNVPHRVIKKDNVEEFGKKLKADIASAKEPAPAGGKGERIKVLFVSNNEAEFWTIAEAGTRKAAKDLAEKGINVEVIFKRPKTGQAGEQTQIIEDNLGDVNAVAISVNDADNQLEFLNKVADKVPLLCVDNDAPKSRRRCYIGTDNIAAGREVGKLVKEALPDGGALAIFVGKPDAPNAIQRRQGVLDELAGK